MNKHLFFLLLIFYFFSAQSVLGAADAAENGDILQSPENTTQVKVGEYSESIPKETIEEWREGKNIFLFSTNIRADFENTDYCPLNKILCELTITETGRQHIVLSPESSLNNEAIKVYLEELANKVRKDPVDAKFKMEDGKVTAFAEAEAGLALDSEKSFEVISEILGKDNTMPIPKEISLPFEIKKPNQNYSDVNNLGISSLIGQGTSDFKGSPKNRVYNIKVATERFNGILIKPDEEFSFVSILGEVDGEHGYLPELVIKNNKTEPEYGGGICQVSTTAFRAAIYSGLKITARRNHAYPVSYYNPQGMDATVYVPFPDLRFINNTPGHILIQTRIEGTKLFFDFYGTNDGRKVEIDGPRIVEKQPDGSMKTTFVQHVYDKEGKETINDIFNSSYDSPNKYPHPGEEILTKKPDDWSKKQWREYQKQN